MDLQQFVAQSLPVQSQGVAVGHVLQAGVDGVWTPPGVLMQTAEVRGVGQSVQLAIDAPLRSPQFAQELGDRVVWMLGRQGQTADIALNPAHLGPLEVKISMAGGEAAAQFFSPHQQVRDAMEAALPRLREMLADAGVTLGQAHVRDESLSRQGTPGDADRQSAGGDEGHGMVGEVPSGLVVANQRARMGLVDLYV
jgi:flagellar hook-length control protein FliK